jgi:hypothetical protein
MRVAMAKRYFKLSDDVHVSGRWELGAPLDQGGQKVWTWLFMRGEPFALTARLRVPLSRPGKPLEFSEAGAAVPIVHEKVRSILTRVAPSDVQLIPAEVQAQGEGYFALNALRKVKCIDDAVCEEVQLWTTEDGQPDLVGEYRVVAGMRIDPMKVGDAKVFRPWGWPVVLIVSEEIKEVMEREGVTGVKFQEVTGSSELSPVEREHNRKLLERLKQVAAAREAFWRTLGGLDEESLVPIIVGAGWPAQRQAWRLIHRAGGGTLLVTDGLSDPDVNREEPSVGFGLELALETDELAERVEQRWQQRLLQRVGDEVAAHERVRECLKVGSASMEVPGEDMPPELVTDEGRVGVLLGMEVSALPRTFDMPAGAVRLVTVQVLLPGELEYLLKQGERGLEGLLQRFMVSGQHHRVSARRRPVV